MNHRKTIIANKFLIIKKNDIILMEGKKWIKYYQKYLPGCL